MACAETLNTIVDDRLEVVAAGWWTESTELDLHDPGSIGASIHRAKAVTAEVERCHFIDAATWFAENIRSDDAVWLKLNCEGAECDVIDHLLDRCDVGTIRSMLVHFDVEKIPGLGERAQETRAHLVAAAVPYIEAHSIMFGRSHELKTANWLSWSEADVVGGGTATSIG